MPHVYLPGEKYSETPLFTIPFIGPFYFTNTTFGLIVADIIVILLAIGVSRGVKSGKMVLTGIPGAVEALLEMLYGITESTAGKWTRQIFPWFAPSPSWCWLPTGRGWCCGERDDWHHPRVQGTRLRAQANRPDYHHLG